jgi:predicted nucleic acid-binding Zn ribbon protein
MRRTGPRSVAHALDALTAGLAPPTVLAEVQRAWPEAAGALFAERAQPYRENAGEVSVRCTEAVLAQELSLMSELVRERLNEAIGRPAVTALRIRVGTP